MAEGHIQIASAYGNGSRRHFKCDDIFIIIRSGDLKLDLGIAGFGIIQDLKGIGHDLARKGGVRIIIKQDLTVGAFRPVGFCSQYGILQFQDRGIKLRFQGKRHHAGIALDFNLDCNSLSCIAGSVAHGDHAGGGIGSKSEAREEDTEEQANQGQGKKTLHCFHVALLSCAIRRKALD